MTQRLVLIGALLVAVAAVGTAMTASTVNAQAWTRDQGSVYVQLSHRYIRADSFYAPDGNTRPLTDGDYVQHVLGIYGEVGVVDRWLTLSLEGELLRSNALKTQGRVLGLGDIRVGAWTGLLTSPFRLAFGVLAGLPTGDDNPSAGAGADPTSQAVARSLPTGDGEYDVHFRLAIGHSFGGGSWPLQHYTLGEVGYAVRTKGLTDQFTWRTELGSRIDRQGWDRLLMVLRLSGTELLGARSSSSTSFGGIGEFEVRAFGLELALRVVDKVHLSVGAEGAFRGRSVPSAAQYKFAISWEYP